MQRIDIGIIGGGASGLMAAVAAADSVKGRPCEIIIFEKKDILQKAVPVPDSRFSGREDRILRILYDS